MFRRSARRKRFGKHDHEYVTNNVGANLQREVCRICGKVCIDTSPPADLRAMPAKPVPDPLLTLVIDGDVRPVRLSRQFAGRRSGR